ncbi:MAG: cupin-like domain-containing protein [Alphaproteobacteria bacterium]|nr:cupin-like domain-containing protein [Alphaproteobacteria bacterium]
MPEWIPRVEGIDLLVEERDGDRLIARHAVGTVPAPVSVERFAQLVALLAPDHEGTGEGWMLRAAAEAVVGLGGTAHTEPTAVDPGWPTAPPAPATLSASGRLDPAWVEWVVEAHLHGRSAQDISSHLRDRFDLPFHAEVARICDGPEVAAAKRVSERARSLDGIVRLRRQFESGAIPVYEALHADTLYERHWVAHRPCLLRHATRDWPEWTLDALRARYADRTVTVTSGRQSTGPEWWRRRSQLDAPMAFGALLDLVANGAGDETYAVARNHVLAALPGLEAELGPLPGLRDAPVREIWLGPRGTVTPLHHDQTCGWLVQRIGVKRLWLASPLETALLDTATGLHNRADPSDPGDPTTRTVRWHEVVLRPGDALFIPAGWWHQVVAESPSLSVSMNGFQWDDDCTWYYAGPR